MLQNSIRKRGFTLLEMVIAMFLLGIFISGVSVLFTYMMDSFVSSQFIGKSYDKAKAFKTSYTYYKSNNPQLIYQSGGVSVADTNGFKLLAFANQARTSGFIVGVYDLINNKVVSGSNLNYSDYAIFTAVLDSAGVSSVQSNMNSYLTAAGSGGLNIYKDLKVIKFGYEPLNSTDIGKMDMTIVAEYYKEYRNQPIERFLTNNKLLTSFNISIVK